MPSGAILELTPSYCEKPIKRKDPVTNPLATLAWVRYPTTQYVSEEAVISLTVLCDMRANVKSLCTMAASFLGLYPVP